MRDSMNKKQSKDKRDKRVMINLTFAEYAKYKNAAEIANLSLSNYLRMRLQVDDEKRTIQEVNVPIKEWKKLIALLRPMSANLNQAQHTFNRKDYKDENASKEAAELANTIDELKEKLTKLWADDVALKWLTQ